MNGVLDSSGWIKSTNRSDPRRSEKGILLEAWQR